MSNFKPGDKVHHPLFGAGTVRAVSGSGPDARITIDFSSSVGQKKLLASVANLHLASSGDAESVSQPSAWYEIVEAQLQPLPGRRPLQEKFCFAIQRTLRNAEFWISIRERVRRRGAVPKVLDDISGNVACSLLGVLKIQIVIRHGELIRAENAVLALSIYDELASRFLQDFQAPRLSPRIATEHRLRDADIVVLGDSASEELPEREPLRRPVRVTPKGVIKSIPKRRDDY